MDPWEQQKRQIGTPQEVGHRDRGPLLRTTARILEDESRIPPPLLPLPQLPPLHSALEEEEEAPPMVLYSQKRMRRMEWVGWRL